jgi:hypothetical protein
MVRYHQLDLRNPQISFSQIELACLAERCSSPEAYAEETWELFELMDRVGSLAAFHFLYHLISRCDSPMRG